MFAGGVAGGKDWTTFFIEGVFPTLGTPFIKTSSFTRGFNLAQGMTITPRVLNARVDTKIRLRYPTMLYLMNRNSSLLDQTALAVNLVTKYQLTLAGSITADDHLGGLSPQRGYASSQFPFYTIGDSGEISSETCTSVEMMFSMVYLYQFHGINAYADRAERVTFNSLPAALSPDCKFSMLWTTDQIQVPRLKISQGSHTSMSSKLTSHGLAT
jgi:hypothetical protein